MVLEKRTQEVVLKNVAQDSWIKLNPGTVSKIIETRVYPVSEILQYTL